MYKSDYQGIIPPSLKVLIMSAPCRNACVVFDIRISGTFRVLLKKQNMIVNDVRFLMVVSKKLDV